MDPLQLPAFIKRSRKNLRLTQAELGKRAGLTRGIVNHIEQGRSKIGLIQLAKILTVMDLQFAITKREHICLDTN